MLKKTLLMLTVVAGLASIAVIPAASAQTRAPAAKTKTVSACPPGTSGAPNYCEPHCVVPKLVGYGLISAFIRTSEANCKVGRLILTFKSPKANAALNAKKFGLFTVVRQFPSPGTIEPYHFKLTIYVKFNL